MQVNLIAPCPKKPSSTNKGNSNWYYDPIHLEDVKDACLELQQILQYNASFSENIIARTRNPMTQDSSFIIPLHQAVSQLHITETIQRPKSYCVGERI